MLKQSSDDIDSTDSEADDVQMETANHAEAGGSSVVVLMDLSDSDI